MLTEYAPSAPGKSNASQVNAVLAPKPRRGTTLQIWQTGRAKRTIRGPLAKSISIDLNIVGEKKLDIGYEFTNFGSSH